VPFSARRRGLVMLANPGGQTELEVVKVVYKALE
jgi:hypothetical protein